MRGNLPQKFLRYDTSYVMAIYRRPLDTALALVELIDAHDATVHIVGADLTDPDDTLAHALAALEVRMAERRSHITTARPGDLSPSVEQQARILRKFTLKQAKLAGIDTQAFDKYMPDDPAFYQFHRHVAQAAEELGFSKQFLLLHRIFQQWGEKEFAKSGSFNTLHDLWLVLFGIDPDGAAIDGYDSRTKG